MNPLSKNETLQHLPNELLQNPERNAIQAYLKKKLRTFGKLKIAMIVAFIIYLVILYIFETIHTTIKELAVFDNIFNLVPLAIFLVSTVAFYKRQKMFVIPEDELDAAIEELKSQQMPA